MASSNKIRVITSTAGSFFIVIMLFVCCIPGGFSRPPGSTLRLKLLGTRSWIKVSWQVASSHASGYRVYWSTNDVPPSAPSLVIPASDSVCYIRPVKEQTLYHIWVQGFNEHGTTERAAASVVTTKTWSLAPDEASQLDIPSSAAVPAGMQLYWHDEFNDSLLDRNKWFTDYYSELDFLEKVKIDELRRNQLPQAAYTLNGRTIDLFVNDSLPREDFEGGKKISSIQTYDWSTNENLLDNSRGGYYEARVKRAFTGHPQGLNTAFWFDSPGPDLSYYLQDGTEVNGVKGIRPKGQLFEIDIFENLNAQFVMHGHVDSNGRFIHNLATDIAYGFEHKDHWVTHGILWTPTSIKHYIDGKLIKAYDNKHQVFSPNHVMNILLGSYGKGGTVSMEVDYIRGYQWPISRDNELPNGDFEANSTLDPWEGNGTLEKAGPRTGKQAVALAPGDSIEQYVYLNNDTGYELEYYAKGHSKLKVEIDNVEAVTGQLTPAVDTTAAAGAAFAPARLRFRTAKMARRDMKTVRIVFRNEGRQRVILDDVRVS